MLTEHGEAIDSDLSRYHRLDVAHDLGTDRLTYGRLRALLEHLPRESSYVQAVIGEAALWGQHEHLLATLIDAVVTLNRNVVQSTSKQRLPIPDPLPRPGMERRQANGRQLVADRHSLADMRRILDEWSAPDVD